MREQLKPCPFCGDVAEFEHSASEATVRCMGCGAQLHRSYNPLVVKSYEEGQKREKADVIAAWNTRPEAAQVRVKDLEWVPTEIEGKHLRDIAADMDGKLRYEVGVTPGNFYLLVSLPKGGLDSRGNYSSVEAAKAAAQADYEHRISAALEPDTVTGWQAAKQWGMKQ